ncbi:MAG: glycerophosphodiester phosphodiesterase [Chitinophagaceae bacterium]|nr:MAG: glycerophosphodiester phosphodiesterase [Chitinophagaceae bacterium]
MIPFLLLAGGITAWVVYKARHVPLPKRRWRRFRAPGTRDLDAASCQALEGIYRITAGSDFFGASAVIKWTYTRTGTNVQQHLSFFCAQDGAYFVCGARTNGNDLLLHGYWRKLSASGTGTVRLEQRGKKLNGFYGKRNQRPGLLFSLERLSDLPDLPSFHIIAHRGGARNVDFLPVSENSLAMLLMAARLGATGVEIDVRWTKDDVPVLAHDSFLAFDSVRTALFKGFIADHTLDELRKIRLRKGGQVPTLREALDAVLHRTPLQVVWLDIKEPRDLRDVRALQEEYLQEAARVGRHLEIYIGVPDKDIKAHFQALPDYQNIPSLCEMDPAVAEELGANVWAPQYTGGPQPEAVAAQQAQGRSVFTWSLDNLTMIRYFMSRSSFDGLVTNAAPVVAHWWWTSGIGNRQSATADKK